MTKPAIDAVVFDFHGTLGHAPGFHYDLALDLLAGALGVVPFGRDAFAACYRDRVKVYRRRAGVSGREEHNTIWLADVLTSLGVPSRPDDTRVIAAVDAYFERYAAEVRLFAESAITVERLAGSLPVALLSNFTDPRPVRAGLAIGGLDRWLDPIVISADLGWRKPHPAIFENVLGRLGTTAGRTLYVGDDLRDDIGGASGVGMLTAWVKGPPSTIGRMLPSAPPADPVAADFVLDGVGDLVALLGA